MSQTRRICLLISLALLVLYHAGASADSAEQQQQRAIARIDQYIDHFRRTFDRTSLAGELGKAESELRDTVSMFIAAGKPHAAAMSLIKLGDIYRYRQQWSQAIDAYQQAMVHSQKAKAADLQCQTLLGHARALLYGSQAADAAKKLTLKAIPLATGLEEPKCRFDSLDLLSQSQVALGDLAGAADSLNRAFASIDQVKDTSLLFYGYLDRADIYQKLAEKCDFSRDFEPCLQAANLAERDYRKAQQIATQLGWSALADQARGFLNRLGIRKNMIESQRRMHGLVTQTNLFSPTRADEVVISNNYIAGANPYASGLLAWIESQGGLPTAQDARGAYIHGLFNEMNGNMDKAFEFFIQATDLLEQDRGNLKQERARGAFIEDKVEFYYTALLHMLQRQRNTEAFELMEQSRSRVMLDLIRSKPVSLGSVREKTLYAQQLTLAATISQYQNCLFAARSNMQLPDYCSRLEHDNVTGSSSERGGKPDEIAGDRPMLDIESLGRALTRLQDQYLKQSVIIEKETPRLGDLTRSEPVTLKDVQKTLRADGSELIAYLSLESQLLIWHVRPDRLTVRSVFLPRSELKRKIATLRSTLIDPTRKFDKKTAHELYLYLLSPVIDNIRSKHLVIIPHEDLYYLPFQALSMGDRSGYVGSQFEISYVPSASILNTLPPPRPLSKPQLFAVADPSLRHAPDEVRALGDRFGGTVHDKTLITESMLRTSVKENTLVHLAVHGTFVADEPLLSYLHLKKDKQNDGKLTAAEMYGLPLDKARLVTLSACETGTVKATHANEVLGITRGLLFAGADALLLSSWKIDDAATARWMKAFYVNAGLHSTAHAARSAIQTLLSDPAYVHPYYWSPFLLISR